MVASTTSVVTGAGRTNESATSAATPAVSSARTNVIQSAGWMAGSLLRARPTASSAVAVQPAASPTTQLAMLRPVVSERVVSRTEVASPPMMISSRNLLTSPPRQIVRPL